MERDDIIEGASQLSDQLERLTINLGDYRSFPPEVQDLILASLPWNEVYKARLVCKSFLNVIKRRTFHQARARLCLKECSLSPLVFYAEKDSWHLRGFDYNESELSDQLQRLSITRTYWSSLPAEVQYKILAHLPLNELYKSRLVSRSFRNIIKRRSFRQARARLRLAEDSLSPLLLWAGKDSWYLWGFDDKEKSWRKLPTSRQRLSAPDPDLFKDFHVAGHKGLFCVDLGNASEAEMLFVCNPLTGETFKVPALEFPRHPVITCMHVTPTKREDVGLLDFKLIAVGSVANGTESLSRKTEVYDSVTRKWEDAGDVPGVGFKMDDVQSGVYCESHKLMLSVGTMVNGEKGILAFDVEKRMWLEDWICPFYQLTSIGSAVRFHTTKLVECSGKIYLFSEQEIGRKVTHCLDMLDLNNGVGFKWTRVLTRKRRMSEATRLLLYNEYTCLPLGENRLCIFNTFEQERPWVVYELLEDSVISETNIKAWPSFLVEEGVRIQSLNLQGSVFELSFCKIAANVTESLRKKS